MTPSAHWRLVRAHADLAGKGREQRRPGRRTCMAARASIPRVASHGLHRLAAHRAGRIRYLADLRSECENFQLLEIQRTRFRSETPGHPNAISRSQSTSDLPKFLGRFVRGNVHGSSALDLD